MNSPTQSQRNKKDNYSRVNLVLLCPRITAAILHTLLQKKTFANENEFKHTNVHNLKL